MDELKQCPICGGALDGEGLKRVERLEAYIDRLREDREELEYELQMKCEDDNG